MQDKGLSKPGFPVNADDDDKKKTVNKNPFNQVRILYTRLTNRALGTYLRLRMLPQNHRVLCFISPLKDAGGVSMVSPPCQPKILPYFLVASYPNRESSLIKQLAKSHPTDCSISLLINRFDPFNQ